MILCWFKKTYNNTLLSLQFFSSLPIPDFLRENASQPPISLSPPALNQAVASFPIAGFLIALPLALLWYVTSVFFTPLLAACIVIAVGILITGALHEDGLADCADGLCSVSSRERKLEIMRDSTIGVYGATALFFSFTLRLFALASLSPWNGALALLMAHSVARGAIVMAIFTSDYARPKGLADTVCNGITKSSFYETMGIAFALSFVITLVTGSFDSLLATAAGMASAYGLLQWLKFHLGGYTGDGLGAMEQVAEITILIILSGLWS